MTALGEHPQTHERQAIILRFVWRQWDKGLTSHVRDLFREAGYRSVSGAHYACEELLRDGWLARAGDNDACYGYTRGWRLGGVDAAGRVYGVIG